MSGVRKQQKNMKHKIAQTQYLVPTILNIYHVFPDFEIEFMSLDYKIKQKIEGDTK